MSPPTFVPPAQGLPLASNRPEASLRSPLWPAAWPAPPPMPGMYGMPSPRPPAAPRPGSAVPEPVPGRPDSSDVLPGNRCPAPRPPVPMPSPVESLPGLAAPRPPTPPTAPAPPTPLEPGNAELLIADFSAGRPPLPPVPRPPPNAEGSRPAPPSPSGSRPPVPPVPRPPLYALGLSARSRAFGLSAPMPGPVPRPLGLPPNWASRLGSRDFRSGPPALRGVVSRFIGVSGSPLSAVRSPLRSGLTEPGLVSWKLGWLGPVSVGGGWLLPRGELTGPGERTESMVTWYSPARLLRTARMSSFIHSTSCGR